MLKISMYSGYGIAFYVEEWWSFGNGTAKNVIIFGVDNSSSLYFDNLTNNLLTLGKDPTFRINGNFGEPEEKFSTNFLKQIQNFA